MIKIIVILGVLFVVGYVLTQSVQDGVTDSYTTALKEEAYTELDNPFQRILLKSGKIVVESKNEKGKYTLSAYTLFKLKIAGLTMCASGSETECQTTISY